MRSRGSKFFNSLSNDIQNADSVGFFKKKAVGLSSFETYAYIYALVRGRAFWVCVY